jgi:hypothetical protein
MMAAAVAAKSACEMTLVSPTSLDSCNVIRLWIHVMRYV